MNYSTMKVFDYRDMPDRAKLTFLEHLSGTSIRDYYVSWKIRENDFVSLWLIENGAMPDELVLIVKWQKMYTRANVHS